MNKKLLAVLLASMLLLPSCGAPAADAGTPAVSDAGSVSDETAPEETLPPYTLPAQTSYDGATLTILAADGRNEYFGVSEMTGETVNDAVFNRDIDVETHLNVKIGYEYETSGYSARSTYINRFSSSILADDDAFQIISGPMAFMPSVLADGYFLNINDLSIDLGNPWYIAGLNDTMGIHGKLFTLAGDFSVSTYSTVNVFYYNKTVADSHSSPDFYAIVRDGAWTVDAMKTACSGVTADLNGDGKMDTDNDIHAIMSHNNLNRSWMSAFEINIYEKDQNSSEIVYNGMTERLMNGYEKLKPIFEAGDIAFIQNSYVDEARPFMEDRALFLMCTVAASSYFRDMKSDFGILPYPKLDEAQSEYRMDVPLSSIQWYFPKTLRDAALVSDFTEVYSYYNSLNVIPAYYDVTLKDKYSRDTDTQEMLDLIRDSMRLTYDVCFCDAYGTSGSPFVVLDTVLEQNKEPASYIAANEDKWQTITEELSEKFTNN